MQSVERAQVRHGQEAGTAVDSPVERRKSDAIEETSHIGLLEGLPNCNATQFGLEQIAGDEGGRRPVEPVQERRALRLID